MGVISAYLREQAENLRLCDGGAASSVVEAWLEADADRLDREAASSPSSPTVANDATVRDQILDELEAAREEVAELKQGIASANSASNSYYEKILWHQSQVPERDRRMKAIGAAEELEKVAKLDWFAFTNVTPSATTDMILRRAAKLRQEAEDAAR